MQHTNYLTHEMESDERQEKEMERGEGDREMERGEGRQELDRWGKAVETKEMEGKREEGERVEKRVGIDTEAKRVW